MDTILYPTADKIIELNALALTLLKVKKADSHKLLSRQKLSDSLHKCESYNGDIFDKAVVLLQELVQSHAFASGNRRTAFIATKYFLGLNKKKLKITDNPDHAKIMQGIRENYYQHSEMKEWLQHGKIREFKR